MGGIVRQYQKLKRGIRNKKKTNTKPKFSRKCRKDARLRVPATAKVTASDGWWCIGPSRSLMRTPTLSVADVHSQLHGRARHSHGCVRALASWCATQPFAVRYTYTHTPAIDGACLPAHPPTHHRPGIHANSTHTLLQTINRTNSHAHNIYTYVHKECSFLQIGFTCRTIDIQQSGDHHVPMFDTFISHCNAAAVMVDRSFTLDF